MEYAYKTWKTNDFYDFYLEWNRIEGFNKYAQNWLNLNGKTLSLNHKTNWTIQDIPDMNDYNRLKENINEILNAINSSQTRLAISQQINQVWNVEKANEIELRLKKYLEYIGNLQFVYNVTGLTNCGNNLKLGGVN